jgi:hypothetical protein
VKYGCISSLAYNAPFLSWVSGRSIKSLLGSRLRIASSKSYGLLVAPITTMPSFARLSPSISCINSVKTELCTLLPMSRWLVREPNRASTSSRNTTQGASRLAKLNTALTLPSDVSQHTHSFSPSPTYLSFTSLGYGQRIRLSFTCTESILAPLSLATALANNVLPVPGGPKSKAPVVVCEPKTPPLKASGNNSGRDTMVRIPSMVL